jgi:hypothetical protein
VLACRLTAAAVPPGPGRKSNKNFKKILKRTTP